MRLMVEAWQVALSLSGLLLGLGLGTVWAAPEPGPAGFPLATNIQQLRLWAQQKDRVLCSLRLAGVVCSAGAVKGWLVLRDNSGAELFELDLEGRPLAAGDRVKLEGQACSVTWLGSGLAVSSVAVVDNDGVHGMARRSGEVYLRAGRHPLRLLWFNRLAQCGLRVSFQGPGLARQTVPDALLLRAECDPAIGLTNLLPGLDYRCFEGRWANLAAGWGTGHAVKTGHVANFDIGVRTRDELVGLEFRGYFEAPREGTYTFETESDDGSRLLVGQPSLCLEPLGPAATPAPRQRVPAQLLAGDEAADWTAVEGAVTFASETDAGLRLELRTDTGRMTVTVADRSGLDPQRLLGHRVRAAGVGRGVHSLEGTLVLGALSVLGAADISRLDEAPEAVPGEARALPLLTSAEQVHRLKREEAQRGYPVRLRGVITRAPTAHDSIVIQDSTRGVYVGGLPPRSEVAPQCGDYWEIEGTTAPGGFAPLVTWRQGRRLGAGRLPVPVKAAWDQLINGSLDTQYVEIQGVVTAVLENRLELRLREGKIRLGFFGLEPGALQHFENARVRVQGCLLAAWDKATHRVNVGAMNIASATIGVEEAAPADLFAAPAKRAADLLLFDPNAGAFQRVKVAGQFLGARQGENFMADGSNGVRFELRATLALQPGDLIEVVGFPELGGASPVLREAVARKTGQAHLPKPQPLQDGDWLEAGHDATWVSVEGLLFNQHAAASEQVLELRAGERTVVARLNSTGTVPLSLRVGSRLGLTGVYAARGGDRAMGRGIDSFELLVPAAANVRVLAQAPWLTLPRLLVAFGLVALVLLAAMLWALSLRRQVSAQTVIIRQKAEREAALEERARIAKDIHDDVGANLTYIMMLGERAREDRARPGEVARHTDKIVAYAHSTVQALDEIVWAVNPQNDTLDALVGYLGQYASQFFEATEVRCRLDVPERLSCLVLPARIRHDLFLVVKEALNNVLKHARASEVSVAVEEAAGVLQITIADNGRGFDSGTVAGGGAGDGLANMRKRMEKIGGAFFLASVPGQGTKLQLSIRLSTESTAPASYPAGS